MAYATIVDVHQLNTGRPTYTASSKPTASQVIDFLEQSAAKIDAVLRSRGYAIPVATTATSALKLLEGCNAAGAHALVEQGAQSSDRREAAMKLWQDCLVMLREGELELDAAGDTTQSVTYAAAPSPVFQRENLDYYDF